MRALVIGGTGFIGAPVSRALHESGHEVAVFHRGLTAADLPEPIQHIVGDRVDFAAVLQSLRSFRPDSVVDMTAMEEKDARASIAMIAQLDAAAPIRLVAVSSMDVYLTYGRLIGTEPGPPLDPLLTEDSPLRGVHFPYRDRGPDLERYEKILVERVVMAERSIDGVVMRLPMVYGPWDRQHRILDDLRRMDDGRPALLIPESLAGWRVARAYVDDCARAITLAATHPRAAGRIYHVAEPEALSQEEWAAAIAQAAGWAGQIVRVSDAELPDAWRVPIDTRHGWEADSTRVRTELGYREVVGRDEGLRRTVAHERTHPDTDSPPLDYRQEDALLARLRSGRLNHD